MLAEDYDIVILGAGLVGLTMANLLVKNLESINVTIAVIDKKNLNDNHQQDARYSAFNLASKEIFTGIGIWEQITKGGFGCYKKMQVWEQLGGGEINFCAQDIGESVLGYIIANSLITKLLYNNVKDEKNVIFITDTPKSIMTNKANKSISLNLTDKIINSKLLIGADGANSWLRDSANLPICQKKYEHTALVATIKTELAHQHIARQVFHPSGPLAFLPLKDEHLCSIVWSSPIAINTERLTMDDAGFCQHLSNNFHYQLGKLELVGARNCYPLQRLHAKQYVTDHIALIGDAAHVIHPLAGQGVNLGLQDAAVLTATIVAALNNKINPGHRLILRKYERARKGHNLSMLFGMEFFKQLFSIDIGLVGQFRKLGLTLANDNLYFKKLIMHLASGL